MYSLWIVLQRFCLHKSEVPFIAGHDLIELSYRFESPPILARMISRRSYGGFNESAYHDVLERALDADCLLEPGEVLHCPGRVEATSRFEVAVAETLLGGLMQVIRLHLDSRYTKLRPVSLCNFLTLMRLSFDVNK